MLCDICQRQAKGFCQGCATYFCEDHGGSKCFRCSGAFLSTEPAPPPTETAVFTRELESRQEHGPGFLQCHSQQIMPTVYLDDEPGPPECHICHGLARSICKNCQALYCEEHGSRNSLCSSCARSSLLGIFVFVGAALLLASLALLGSLFS